MPFELIATTSVLLDEIADRRARRKDVAATYALALISSDPTDWKQVNQAIMKRWSFSGLEWIKKQAWRKVA